MRLNYDEDIYMHMPSSHAYVAVKMKQPDSPQDRKLGKVILRIPRNCGHTSTMCSECADQWGQDYYLLFDRTVAGRRLKAELDSLGKGS